MLRCPLSGKVPYGKKDAQTARNVRMSLPRDHKAEELRIYECTCGWWHLTKKYVSGGNHPHGGWKSRKRRGRRPYGK